MKSILAEAARLTSTDRMSTYGHPRADFTRIGRLWGPILDLPAVSPEKVALCMAALKIARLCVTPDHRDSVVDLAGYARTYEMVIDPESVPAPETAEGRW